MGVGTTARAVTAHAGDVLLRDVMAALGVLGEVDATVTVKARARGLSEGRFVAAVAESSIRVGVGMTS